MVSFLRKGRKEETHCFDGVGVVSTLEFQTRDVEEYGDGAGLDAGRTGRLACTHLGVEWGCTWGKGGLRGGAKGRSQAGLWAESVGCVCGLWAVSS